MESGSEVCLHGLEHRVRGPLVAGSVVSRTRARLFAPQSAEFLTLQVSQACEAIDEGVAELDRTRLGFPSTFCAPAWLMPSEYKSILRLVGISGYVGMYSVEDLETKARRYIPGFGFMGGSPPHEMGIRALNTMMHPLHSHARTIKFYLHPDVSEGGGWKPAVEKLKVVLSEGDFRATTYSEILHPRSLN
jgi:predicted deacetylase